MEFVSRVLYSKYTMVYSIMCCNIVIPNTRFFVRGNFPRACSGLYYFTKGKFKDSAGNYRRAVGRAKALLLKERQQQDELQRAMEMSASDAESSEESDEETKG